MVRDFCVVKWNPLGFYSIGFDTVHLLGEQIFCHKHTTHMKTLLLLI